MRDPDYLLSNRHAQAGQRFVALAELFDESTFRHFERIGIAPGWRCWEVGAGGCSVVRWIAERVGRSGRVLATDIDIAWAREAGGGNIEVREHNLVTDPPPEELFDLIHARLVLMHLPQRVRALEIMVGTLRPGGWLVIEDTDFNLQPLSCLNTDTSAARRANKIRGAFAELLVRHGVDLSWGRKVPQLLRAAGLGEVCADAYCPIAMPGSRRLEIGNIELLRSRLISEGLASEDELEQHLTSVRDGTLDVSTSVIVSAWGRKP